MYPKETAVRCVNILHECYNITFGWQVWAPCGSRAHTRVVACHRLTTAKLAIRADDAACCCIALVRHIHSLVTDKLRSYGAAMKVVGNADKQETRRLAAIS